MNKPPFDPNQPFESVKPTFDPSQPFDAGGSSTQAAQSTQAPPPADTSGSFPEISAIANSNKPLRGKLWDAAQVPSQMAERGLQSMAEGLKPTPEYTGNLPRDIIKNYPSFSADVLSKVAPGFINRTSLLTAGAAKGLQTAAPLISAAGRGVAGQVESLTGAKPGALGAAWNDATTMFSKGRKATGAGYNEAEDAGMNLKDQLAASPIFGGDPKSDVQIVRQSYRASKAGTLSTGEAFEARKAADALKGSKAVNQTMLAKAREAFDQIAKQDDAIASTDPAFRKAVMGESLRKILPQNVHGGTSAFKIGIMTALEKMGISGKAALALMSPAAAGVAATAGGLASKPVSAVATNPGASVALKNLIEQYISRRSANDRQRSQ